MAGFKFDGALAVTDFAVDIIVVHVSLNFESFAAVNAAESSGHFNFSGKVVRRSKTDFAKAGHDDGIDIRLVDILTGEIDVAVSG